MADICNNRIQKFDTNGVFQVAWGSLGSSNGQFNWPCGVAVDGRGTSTWRIPRITASRSWNTNGVFQLAWGSNGTGDGHFQLPYGVAVDGQGEVYVADINNGRIQKFDANGTYLAASGQSRVRQRAVRPELWRDGGRPGERLCGGHATMTASRSSAPSAPFWGFRPVPAPAMGSSPSLMPWAVDSQGWHLCDGTIRIQKFDSSGNFLAVLGTGLPGPGPGSILLSSGCGGGRTRVTSKWRIR